MHDAGTLLRMLVAAAETAVQRPLISGDLAAIEASLLRAAPMCADPAGGLLIDDEALLLARVLVLCAKQRHAGDKHRAALLQQLAGVLLPSVREALWHAIEVRRAARPSA